MQLFQLKGNVSIIDKEAFSRKKGGKVGGRVQKRGESIISTVEVTSELDNVIRPTEVWR